MNKQGNTYTFMYAAIMVIIVAALLSFVALQLKPQQKRNVEIEKKQSILKSVNIEATADNAEELYGKYVTESFVVNTKGDKIESVDAFTVDLQKELLKEESQRNLPVYVCNKDGESIMVFPLRGKGLWGPVWGYISLKGDLNTVFGATFDHQGETPGLGAEISNAKFQIPFKGKQIFDESGKFVSIQIVKGGAGDNIHGVDAISGGTITSRGVEAMISDCLSGYEAFLKKSVAE